MRRQRLGLNARGRKRRNRVWRSRSLKGLTGHARDLERGRLKRQEFYSRGLNSYGKTRQLRLWPELRGKSWREVCNARARAARAKLYAQGLTCRGTPRKGGPSELERRWRESGLGTFKEPRRPLTELRPGIGLCDECGEPRWPQQYVGLGCMVCLDCLERGKEKALLQANLSA